MKIKNKNKFKIRKNYFSHSSKNYIFNSSSSFFPLQAKKNWTIINKGLSSRNPTQKISQWRSPKFHLIILSKIKEINLNIYIWYSTTKNKQTRAIFPWRRMQKELKTTKLVLKRELFSHIFAYTCTCELKRFILQKKKSICIPKNCLNNFFYKNNLNEISD